MEKYITRFLRRFGYDKITEMNNSAPGTVLVYFQDGVIRCYDANDKKQIEIDMKRAEEYLNRKKVGVWGYLFYESNRT